MAKTVNYKNCKIEDIIKWCQENDKVDWLKEIAAMQVPCKVYPKVKGEDGRLRADKSAIPTIEERPITFIQLKREFFKAFFPNLLPKAKAKKPTMHDIIAGL